MENVLFTLGSTDILVWHLLALIAVIVVIALIIVIVLFSRKKSDSKPAEQVKSETEPSKQSDGTDVVDEQSTDEQPSEQITEETSDDGIAITEEEDDEPVADEEPATEEEAEQEEKEAAERKRPKNYHISLRADGKWQVKLSKGAKPLKLFDTQAQAIAFAKEKAKNQDGSIVIHKVNGQIRKQKY